MSSRTHLVPTSITDKNGKQTIVYVKPKTPAADASMPAVQFKSRQSLLAERLPGEYGSLPHSLRTAILKNSSRVGIRAQEKMLDALHPDTLPKLQAYVDESLLRPFGVLEIINACMPLRSVALLNNLAIFTGIPASATQQNSYHWYPGGLQAYRNDGDKPIDYSNASAKELEVARALILAAMKLEMPNVKGTNVTSDGPMVYLTSDKLCRFIESRPQDVIAITEIIKERQLVPTTAEDISHIKRLLNSDNPSLREGLL